jgi:PAS domain S-box-containing protein
MIAKVRKAEDRVIAQRNDTLEKSYTYAYYSILSGIGISSIIFIVIFVILNKKASRTFEFESQEISREELESIVKARTAEISQINNRLNSKINDLQKMDLALKQSEKYYRMLFEQAHDAIIIFSPESQVIIDANKRACEMYGYTKEEFIGLSQKKINKNNPQSEDNVKQILQHGLLFNYQQVHYTKDGSEILVETNATLIKYAGKYAILAHNRDVTDRVLKFI